jgi:hypothetical protein
MRWTRQRFARKGMAGWIERSVSDHQASGREMLQRTAKSCGPDAPTLASRSRSCVGPTGLRQDVSADDGGKQAWSPGRARRKPLKPLRAGMPGDSGVLVVTRVRSTTTKCTRGRGCNGHPAFPTPSFGREIYQRLGRMARRGCERVSRIRTTSLRAKRGSNPESVIPGWSAGPDLRCAIAHRGISRFRVRCGACHRAALCADPLASPRNDGRAFTYTASNP